MTRYRLDECSECHMVSDHCGNWVKYEDVERMVSKVRNFIDENSLFTLSELFGYDEIFKEEGF